MNYIKLSTIVVFQNLDNSLFNKEMNDFVAAKLSQSLQNEVAGTNEPKQFCNERRNLINALFIFKF